MPLWLQMQSIQQIYQALQALRPEPGQDTAYQEWQQVTQLVQSIWPLGDPHEEPQSPFGLRVCQTLQELGYQVGPL